MFSICVLILFHLSLSECLPTNETQCFCNNCKDYSGDFDRKRCETIGNGCVWCIADLSCRDEGFNPSPTSLVCVNHPVGWYTSVVFIIIGCFVGIFLVILVFYRCHKDCCLWGDKKPVEIHHLSLVKCEDDWVCGSIVVFLFFLSVLAILGLFLMMGWNFAKIADLLEKQNKSPARVCDFEYYLEYVDKESGTLFFDLLSGLEISNKFPVTVIFLTVWMIIWTIIDTVLTLTDVEKKLKKGSLFSYIVGFTFVAKVVVTVMSFVGVVYSTGDREPGWKFLLVWPIVNAIAFIDSLLNLFFSFLNLRFDKKKIIEQYQEKCFPCLICSISLGAGTGISVDSLFEAILNCLLEGLDLSFAFMYEANQWGEGLSLVVQQVMSFVKIVALGVRVAVTIKKHVSVCGNDIFSLLWGCLFGGCAFAQLLVFQLRSMGKISENVRYTHLQTPLIVGVSVCTLLTVVLMRCYVTNDDSYFDDGNAESVHPSY